MSGLMKALSLALFGVVVTSAKQIFPYGGVNYAQNAYSAAALQQAQSASNTAYSNVYASPIAIAIPYGGYGLGGIGYGGLGLGGLYGGLGVAPIVGTNYYNNAYSSNQGYATGAGSNVAYNSVYGPWGANAVNYAGNNYDYLNAYNNQLGSTTAYNSLFGGLGLNGVNYANSNFANSAALQQLNAANTAYNAYNAPYLGGIWF
eukprot:CAMPEP_0176434960 /NCGR_PEP_ID=MMETSP0127-20121128/17013_1 /TAXON_ID=938130 /ORGANISM="Platyophrya macrostoma, Strain WH" /LENGTH=202 /DNA_ID=CAMNT_0017817847 /DNA_START=40 /DNA_END=648 /DNA_ORIENTATION=+